MPNNSYYIGIMTGTSMDGVDAVLMSANNFRKVIHHHAEPFPKPLLEDLTDLVIEPTVELAKLGELNVRLAKWYAQVVERLLNEAKIARDQVAAIGCHGQTIYHEPDGNNPYSLQLLSGAHLAQFAELTVVNDFRNQDMAAGGQGAPLASAYHQYLLDCSSQNYMVINLGGIANCTYLPKENSLPKDSNRAIGFDTGPANTLMDCWINKHLEVAYDALGHWAQTGKIQETLLVKLLSDDYFELDFPKSTGREYFNLNWLESHLNSLTSQYTPEDVQATLLALTCHTIADACKSFEVDQFVVCGGGVHNPLLIEQLKSLLGGNLVSCEDYGLKPQQMEAAAFAWLAYRCMNKQKGTIPSVTGAKRATISGAIHQFL